MRSYLFFLLLVILTNHSLKTFGQEEFYGDQNGLSFTYLKSLNENAYAGAVSVYLKKGFILGATLESVYNYQYPGFSFLVCPGWRVDTNHIKFAFGPTYAYIMEHHILGFDVGIVPCFFTKSNFPFSLSLALSTTFDLTKTQSPDPYLANSGREFIPVVGFGYIQAFFTKSNIHPFIGIGNAYSLESKENFFSAMAGLNIRLE